MGFKENYLKLQQKNKISFAEIGRRCGVSKGSAWAWAHSHELPTIEHLKQLAQVFACTVDELIKDDDFYNQNMPGIVAQVTPQPTASIDNNQDSFIIAMCALSPVLSEQDKSELLKLSQELINRAKSAKKSNN
jgi:transcriptional regulator with XRE-family HTH domain